MARNERGRGVTVVDESMDDYTYGTLDFGHSQSTRGLGVGQGPAITSTLPRSKAGQQQQQHQAAGAAQWAASSIPLNDESIGGLNAHSPNLPSPGFLHGAHLRQSIHPSPAVAERYARGARGAYASGTAQQRASYPASSSSLDTASEDEDDEDDISETRTPETRSTGNHVDLRATPVGQSRTVKQFDRPTLGEEKMARLKAAEQRNFRHGKNRTEARRDAQTQQDGEGLAARAQRINRATSTSRANLPSSPSPAPSLTRKGVHRSTQASIDDRRAEQADDIFSQAAPRPQAGDDHEQAHKDDSGGSGYAAGAPSGQEGESSGETLLGSGNVWKGDAYHGMQGLDMPWMRLPSGQKVGQGAYEARLPDLTGITSAMASPAQARDTHVPLAKLRPPPQELDELAQRLDAVKATMQAEEIDMRELDEADVTAAHERAERVFETIALDMGQQTAHTAPNADTTVVAAQHGTHHNAITCTVCGSMYKKERKRVARKEKARRAADAGALADEETVLALLEAGEESGGARMKFGAKQIKVLKRLIKEHMDEFIHSRMLYAELADELKLVEPSMSSKNRQILAEHTDSRPRVNSPPTIDGAPHQVSKTRPVRS
ncbi:Cep57 centrosome microtubule-binding domain [Ceraceosorus bombacis]|uniref:Cep57 centrosome microtubule-binding domain n=1 Tax=Ceraceosorus bombacis TaxID=401625 RepID=A0A0P1BLZ1_9BASI|nr:Cep57 centrosome microtubule-binding domain [Ceraceosorus bombacis]